MPDESATPSLPSGEPPVKKYKRGDVREDGKVFWGYESNREVWKTRVDFEKAKEQARKRARKYYAANRDREKKAQLVRYHQNREKRKAYSREYHIKNKQRSQERNLEYRTKNSEKVKEKQRMWYLANQEKVRESARIRRESGRERIREWEREHYKTKPLARLAKSMRIRTAEVLRSRGFSKTSKLKDYLGCSPEDLKTWIESLFLPGMSWGNRKEWHIDHLVPLAIAKTADEVYLLNHYTNLRPLWEFENISKNKHLPDSLPEYIHPNIQLLYQYAKQQH